MKKLFTGCIFLSAVLIGKAQSADDIVTKHIEALGGKANLEKVKNVVMEGSSDGMGQKVTIKITRVPGKLYRQDITVGTTAAYNVVTDTSGWVFMPFFGQSAPEQLTGDMLKTAQAELPLTDKLVDYKAKGNTIQLSGREDIAGSECYKLAVVSAGGDSSTVFVDTKTYLITRVLTTQQMMGQEIPLNMDYSDYKDVDGVKFPFTMGALNGNVTFSSIKINQPIDAKVYSH